MGLSQLEKMQKFIAKRKLISIKYISFFKENKYCKIITIDNCKPSYHLIFLQINFKLLKINKDDLFKYLNSKNIYPQYHYIPIYKFSFFKKKVKLTNSEYYYNNTLSLPVYYDLKHSEQKKICSEIKFFIEKNIK